MHATSRRSARPQSSEYPSFYGGYIGRAPDGDIVRTMREQRERLLAQMRQVDDSALGGHRYAPGKWSVREVLGHMADTEQVMGFRALHFARRDPSPLPGFSENDYVAIADFDRAPINAHAERFAACRSGHILLFESFDEATMLCRGTASGGEFTVRAIAWILVGHAEHHLDVLRERYGT